MSAERVETPGEVAGAAVVHPPGDGAELLVEPLRSRWSPSFFDADEVLDREVVAALLQAARWAPSAGNSQPWAFLVAERGSEARAALDGALSRGNAWVRRAALVLVAVAQVGPDPGAEPDGKPPRDPAGIGFDLGLAAAHVTVQANATGLSTHQIAGFDKDAVAAALGVPDHARVLNAIVVGHRGDPGTISDADRDREARPRSRRPLSEVALSRWDAPW